MLMKVQLFRRFSFESTSPEEPWKEENWAIMIYWDQWLSIKQAYIGT